MAMPHKHFPALLAAGCLLLASGSAVAQQATFAPAPAAVDPAAFANPVGTAEGCSAAGCTSCGCTGNGCTAEPGSCAAGLGCCGAGGGCCGSGCDCCEHPWTIRANAVFMKRQRPDSLAFVTQANGADAFNFGEFNFNYQPGLDVSLIRKLDCGRGLELRYFGLWDVDDTRRNGPFPTAPTSVNTTPPSGISFLPATFITGDYDSALHSGELNYRIDCVQYLTLLAGFRYLSLDERFNGDFDVPALPTLDADLNSRTSNDLYGLQIGADAVVLQGPSRRFQVNALAKAGVYYAYSDHQLRATQSLGNIVQLDLNGNANDDGVAFVGEVGLIGSYQLTCNTALTFGYQCLWLDGVALASEQIKASGQINSWNTTTRIDNTGNVFYHGANVGLVINF